MRCDPAALASPSLMRGMNVTLTLHIVKWSFMSTGGQIALEEYFDALVMYSSKAWAMYVLKLPLHCATQPPM